MVSILLPWLIPSYQLVKFPYISQLALRAVCPLLTTEYEWSGGSPLGGLTAEMGGTVGLWVSLYISSHNRGCSLKESPTKSQTMRIWQIQAN